MPSVKNPNKPSRNRLAARAATTRKAQQKRSAAGKSKINKADTKRGARPGILPTSGPRAAISNKKLRKLERKMGHAIQRKMDAGDEVEMKGWSTLPSRAYAIKNTRASTSREHHTDVCTFMQMPLLPKKLLLSRLPPKADEQTNDSS